MNANEPNDATESNVSESVSGADQTTGPKPEALISAEITNTVMQFAVEDILQRLKAFSHSLKPRTGSQRKDTGDAALPTVGIIGMGRCGTNIAIDLANLVYEQRKIGVKELSRRGRTAVTRRSASADSSGSGQAGSRGKQGAPSFWERLLGAKSERDQVFLV